MVRFELVLRGQASSATKWCRRPVRRLACAMPQPWISLTENEGYFWEHGPEKGDYMEIQMYGDDMTEDQGTGIAHVLDVQARSTGVGYKLHILAVSDHDYHQWLFDTKERKNPGWYWFSSKPPASQVKFEGIKRDPCGKYRTLHAGEIDKKNVKWLGAVCLRKVKKYLESVERPPAPSGASKRGEHVEDGAEDRLGGALSRRDLASSPRLFEEAPEARNSQEDKEDKKNRLRMELENLEKELEDQPANAGKGRRSTSHDKRERTSSRQGPFGEIAPHRAEKAAPFTREDAAAQPVRERDTERPSAPCAQRGSDRLDRSRSRRRRHRSTTPPSEEEEQYFREASRSSTKHGRIKLVTFARRCPGSLANRMLQRMQGRVIDEGEATRMMAKLGPPVVGKQYYAKVLKGKLTNKRNAQEAKTLLTILDHVTARRYNEAADVLAQRIKAIEAAQEAGGWESARFLELVDDDEDWLMEKEEQAMVAQERRFESTLRDQHVPTGGGHASLSWKGKALKGEWNANSWRGNQQQDEGTDSGTFKGRGKASPFEARPASPEDFRKGDSKGKSRGKKGKWW